MNGLRMLMGIGLPPTGVGGRRRQWRCGQIDVQHSVRLAGLQFRIRVAAQLLLRRRSTQTVGSAATNGQVVTQHARVAVVDLWRCAVIVRMHRCLRIYAGLVAQHVAVLQEDGRVGVPLGLVRLVNKSTESIGHSVRHSRADRGRLMFATTTEAAQLKGVLTARIRGDAAGTEILPRAGTQIRGRAATRALRMLQDIVDGVVEGRHAARALGTGPERRDLRDDVVKRPVSIVIVLRLRTLDIGGHSHLAKLLAALWHLLESLVTMSVLRLCTGAAAAVRHLQLGGQL